MMIVAVCVLIFVLGFVVGFYVGVIALDTAAHARGRNTKIEGAQ